MYTHTPSFRVYLVLKVPVVGGKLASSKVHSYVRSHLGQIYWRMLVWEPAHEASKMFRQLDICAILGASRGRAVGLTIDKPCISPRLRSLPDPCKRIRQNGLRLHVETQEASSAQKTSFTSTLKGEDGTQMPDTCNCSLEALLAARGALFLHPECLWVVVVDALLNRLLELDKPKVVLALASCDMPVRVWASYSELT